MVNWWMWSYHCIISYHTHPTTKINGKYMIQKTLWLWLVIMNIPLYHTVPTQLQKFMLQSLYDTWYIRHYGYNWWMWSYHCIISYHTHPTTKFNARVLVWYMIHKILRLWLINLCISLYQILPTKLQIVC